MSIYTSEKLKHVLDLYGPSSEELLTKIDEKYGKETLSKVINVMISLHLFYDESLNDLLLRTLEHIICYDINSFDESINLIKDVGNSDFNKYATVLNFVQVIGDNYSKINEARGYANLEFDSMFYYFSKLIKDH